MLPVILYDITKSLIFDDCFFRPLVAPLLDYFCNKIGVVNGDDVLLGADGKTSIGSSCDAVIPSTSELLKLKVFLL